MNTQNIEIDCHIVGEKLQVGITSHSFVPTEYEVTNICTKALDKKHFLTLQLYVIKGSIKEIMIIKLYAIICNYTH